MLDRVGARWERDGESVNDVGVRAVELGIARYADRLYSLGGARSGERHIEVRGGRRRRRGRGARNLTSVSLYI